MTTEQDMIKPDSNWYKKVKIPENLEIKVSEKEIDQFIKDVTIKKVSREEAKVAVWLDKKHKSDMKKYPGFTTSSPPQKQFCKQPKCFGVDKSIKNEYIKNINNNDVINVTYTCAGHTTKQIDYPDNKITNIARGLKTEHSPATIGFETRFESNLCPVLEKNIQDIKCKSENNKMTKYIIEPNNPNPKNNEKFWHNASVILGNKDFILENLDITKGKTKMSDIEKFKKINY